MYTNKQRAFLAAVAEAARQSEPRPRNRLNIENLTSVGRAKGLSAMHDAPRCSKTTKSGKTCKNPAMRGAKRCRIHGGRVEVPNHPSNIRAFISGEMHRKIAKQMEYIDGKAIWDSLSSAERRGLVQVLPDQHKNDVYLRHLAARAHKDSKIYGYLPWGRFLKLLRNL